MDILFGFELALPFEIFSEDTSYVSFIPQDYTTPLITFDDKEYEVRDDG